MGIRRALQATVGSIALCALSPLIATVAEAQTTAPKLIDVPKKPKQLAPAPAAPAVPAKPATSGTPATPATPAASAAAPHPSGTPAASAAPGAPAGSAAAAAPGSAAAAGSAAPGSSAAPAGSGIPAAPALSNFDPSKLAKLEDRLDALRKRVDERTQTRAARKQAQQDRDRIRWGALVDQPNVRAELDAHAMRVARLERIQELAQVEAKPAIAARASKALDKENARHERTMSALAAGGAK